VATAVVALLAAGFAAWQVWEIRRTREEQARPFVVVDIRPSTAASNILNLVIENVGTTVARNVTFEFEPPLQSSQEKYDLSESVLIRTGIPTLPPRRRIEALFDVSHERVNTNLPMRYDVTVNLSDARGRRQGPEQYVVDLSHLYGLLRVEEYGIHHAAKALREIQATIKKWSDIHGRLKVWVRDEDRHLLDERVESALTGHHPSLATTSPGEIAMTLGRNVVVRWLFSAIRGLRRHVAGAQRGAETPPRT